VDGLERDGTAKETVVFSYAQIEAILARVHEVTPQQIGAFKARLQHLRRLGVPIGLDGPGKGKRVEYTREHLCQLVLCLECAQLGFDPTWTVGWVQENWAALARNVFWAAYVGLKGKEPRRDVDWFVFLYPRLLKLDTGTGTRPHALAGDRAAAIKVLDGLAEKDPRVCILNMSETLWRVRTAERAVCATSDSGKAA
jgi:hypothetical protein